MIDWKISIGAVLVMLLGVLLGHRLTKVREEQKNYRERAREFKEMFVPFIRELESVDAHPTLLVLTNFELQDEAARKLVMHMSAKMKRRFDVRWNIYKAVYQEKNAQGILGKIATEVDDISMVQPGHPDTQYYVTAQTARRRNEILQLVKDALGTL